MLFQCELKKYYKHFISSVSVVSSVDGEKNGVAPTVDTVSTAWSSSIFFLVSWAVKKDEIKCSKD